MTVPEVLALLDAERDERGMRNWTKLGASTAGMSSYGIGLTKLRKLAKGIGRNRELAQALWRTDVYDARVIALLIDDPAQITRDQAEKQVEAGILALGDVRVVSATEVEKAVKKARRPELLLCEGAPKCLGDLATTTVA